MTQYTLSQMGSPIGPLAMISSEKGLCRIYCGDAVEFAATRFTQKKPEAIITRDDASHERLSRAVLAYLQEGTPLPNTQLDIEGTSFQKACWRELQRIPCGETISYQELANRAGNAKASRAAGSACGKNPVFLFIPCHRVLASDGTLGGFGWGLDIKQRLLDIEHSSMPLCTAA